MKNRILTVILTLFLLNSVFSQELGYTSYTSIDGLAQNQITCVYQDKNGFLWIGSKDGVSRFDCTNFKNYRIREGLITNFVLDILEYGNKMIVLTRKGISLIDKKGIFNLHLNENIVLLQLNNSINIDHRNKITFPYLENNILKFSIYDNGEITPAYELNNLISKNETFKSDIKQIEVFYNKRYNCYYIRADNSIFFLNKDKLIKIFSTRDRNILIKKGQDQELYLYAENIFYRFVNDKLVFFRHNETNYDVLAFNIDKKGYIYQIVDFDECYFAINNKIFKNNFISQVIIFIDKEDNIWLGGENGIQKVFTKSFVNFNSSSRKLFFDVWDVSEVNNNIYFFSFSRGVSKYDYKSNSVEKVDLPDFLKSKRFYMGNSIYKDGKILVNVNGAGVCVFDGKNFSKLCPKIPFEYAPIFTYYDKDNETVLSGTSVGLIKFKNKGYTLDKMPFRSSGSLKQTVVSIIKDTLGRYWLGGFKKLSLLKNDSIITLPNKELPYEFGANTMCVDHKGNIWLGSQEGLFLYDYKTFKKIDIPNINSVLGFVKFIDKNRLLIGSMNKLSVLFLDNFYLTGVPKVKSFDRNNGFMAIECLQNGAMVDSKGNIWITGGDKVVMMEQSCIKINYNVPSTYFIDLSYINPKMEKFSISENSSYVYKLSHEQKNIRIDYGATSTTAPKRVKFKYMLDGFDLTWSEPTDLQFAIYTNLPPKSYTFRVKACNEDEIWSQNPSEIKIMITPAYWQTWWFRITALVLLISSTFFVTFKILMAKRKQIQKKYENEKKIKELQLKSLKSQIDPHFTFNAINAISSLIYKEERKLAYHYFTKFAQLVRNVLLSSNSITRSIKDEIFFIENYLEIEKFRFKNKFDYVIDVEKNVDTDIQIPQMLIQTYVENSIKHGLMHLSKDGILHVKIKTDQSNNIIISIIDNGIGRERASKVSTRGAGLGIAIMNQFFDLFNSVNSSKIVCEITDLYDSVGEVAGTQVEIFFPKDFKYSM